MFSCRHTHSKQYQEDKFFFMISEIQTSNEQIPEKNIKQKQIPKK